MEKNRFWRFHVFFFFSLIGKGTCSLQRDQPQFPRIIIEYFAIEDWNYMSITKADNRLFYLLKLRNVFRKSLSSFRLNVFLVFTSIKKYINVLADSIYDVLKPMYRSFFFGTETQHSFGSKIPVSPTTYFKARFVIYFVRYNHEWRILEARNCATWSRDWQLISFFRFGKTVGMHFKAIRCCRNII